MRTQNKFKYRNEIVGRGTSLWTNLCILRVPGPERKLGTSLRTADKIYSRTNFDTVFIVLFLVMAGLMEGRVPQKGNQLLTSRTGHFRIIQHTHTSTFFLRAAYIPHHLNMYIYVQTPVAYPIVCFSIRDHLSSLISPFRILPPTQAKDRPGGLVLLVVSALKRDNAAWTRARAHTHTPCHIVFRWPSNSTGWPVKDTPCHKTSQAALTTSLRVRPAQLYATLLVVQCGSISALIALPPSG
jgi:hypothetical protein